MSYESVDAYGLKFVSKNSSKNGCFNYYKWVFYIKRQWEYLKYIYIYI
uniref:Uncharacterized protein n=1 Tax=Heterorhabditis bacteriophora TaxID=37862 RepID=A0A1I7WFM9_HETBA